MNVNISRCSDTSILDVRDAYRPEDYAFSVDWLNVRLDCDSIDLLILRLLEFLPELDMQDFQTRESGGVCFYKNGLHIPKIGHSSFVIAYNVDENGEVINKKGGRGQLYGVLLSLSGDGCRFVDSLHNGAFIDFMEAISVFNPVCTRIDMACDIFDKENSLVPMIQSFADTAYDRENAAVDLNCNLTRLNPDGSYRQWVTCNLVFDKKINDFTRNVTVGGRDSSKGTLQLYNKRVEIENGRLSALSDAVLESVGNPEYWWRLEYRCKSYAQNVYENLYQSKSVYSAFAQACCGFGKFVSPYDTTGIHIEKSEVLVEWASFLLFLEKLCANPIHLVQFASVPYIPVNLHKVERFFNNQVAGSFAVNVLMCCLDKEYRRRMLYNALNTLIFNKRYKPALDELKQKYGLKINSFSEAKEWCQDYFDLGA